MATALSNLLALLALDNSSYIDGLTSTKNVTDDFATKLSNVGGAVVVGGLSAAAAAVVGVGAAAWDAGNTMDDAMDIIRVATGATGADLAGLQTDFEAVFQGVPTDAKSAADAIGMLNTRLGVTGAPLQDISKSLLEVTRIMGGDLTANADTFTRIMGDWGVPVDKASSTLDGLFVATQKTGITLDQLMQQVVQYGAPMRNFGFDFNQAAALLSTFAAQGVNTEIVMSGLRTAQGKFIKQGVDMKTGLWDTIDAIKNATSQTDALAIATDVFGAKAAGDWLDTIQGGKFDLDELTKAMMNADGAIMETAASTQDWGEKWTMFKNKITTALAPIGAQMMDGVGQAMDAVVGIFERPDVQSSISSFVDMIGSFITQAVAYIPTLINGIFQFITFLQNNQGVVVAIFVALGVAALAWGITTAVAAWTAIAPLLPVIAVIALIAAAAYLLYEAWTNNWGGIRDMVMNAWSAIKPVFDAIVNVLQTAIPVAVQFVQAYFQQLQANIMLVANFINTFVVPIFRAVADVIGAVLGVAIKAAAGFFQNVLLPPMQTVANFIRANVVPVVQTFADWLSGKLSPAIQGIGNAIRGMISWMHNLADSIRNISLPSWLTPGSPTPFELGLWGISKALQDVNRQGFQVPVGVPVSAAAGLGGAAAHTPTPERGDKTVNVTINNPKGETSEDSVRKELKKLSYLGVVS